MKVKVKAEHIKAGRVSHVLLDPLVIAVREQVSSEYHHVYTNIGSIIVHSTLSFKIFLFDIPLEYRVHQIISEMGRMAPITVELEGF